MTLLVWVHPTSHTALIEQYLDMERRQLSLIRIDESKIYRINSLELRSDEIQVDNNDNSKMAIYVPLLGSNAGKSFRVCKIVSQNRLRVHLMDKLGIIAKYSPRMAE